MKVKSEEQIEKLKQTLLDKEKEIEKLGKRSISLKTIIAVVLVICSLIYYMKVRDENLIEFKAKAIKDLEVKDKKIDSLNKELVAIRKTYESASQEVNKKKTVGNELDAIKKQLKTSEETIVGKDNEINKLKKDLETNRKTFESVSQELLNKKTVLNRSLETINKQLKTSEETIVRKDKEINKLKEELDPNRKSLLSQLENVTKELNNKKSIITNLDKDLVAVRTQLKTSEESIGSKEKQIKDLLNEIQLRDAENERLVTRLNHGLMIREASEASAEILFAMNQTIADQIIDVVVEILDGYQLFTCTDDPTTEFDVYKNCFRDLSIIVHNRLDKYMGPRWAVTTGAVDNCFSINTIDEFNREEYFFTIKDVYFEIFRFNPNVTVAQKIDEELDEKIDEKIDEIVDEP